MHANSKIQIITFFKSKVNAVSKRKQDRDVDNKFVQLYNCKIFQIHVEQYMCWPILLVIIQFMIRKITYLAYNFAQIKNLKTTAVSLPKGLRITYPHVENKTHDIENPL